MALSITKHIKHCVLQKHVWNELRCQQRSLGHVEKPSPSSSSQHLQILHLQHRMQGAASSKKGEATSKSTPKPAKMPTTCAREDRNISSNHTQRQKNRQNDTVSSSSVIRACIHTKQTKYNLALNLLFPILPPSHSELVWKMYLHAGLCYHDRFSFFSPTNFTTNTRLQYLKE